MPVAILGVGGAETGADDVFPTKPMTFESDDFVKVMLSIVHPSRLQILSTTLYAAKNPS